MIRFADIVGHAATIDHLRQAWRQERLAHALVFAGASGIGKHSVARALTGWLLCEQPTEDACGSCGACKRIAAGSHPDVQSVGLASGKKEIGIDRAREIKRFVQLAPVSGSVKVTIVDDADRLSVAAQNGLLKTLEDPAGRAILILVAANADSLLATVRSRCQRVRFRPLAPEEVETILRERQAVEAATAQRLSRLCEGSPGRALELAATEAVGAPLLPEIRSLAAGRYAELARVAARLGEPESALGFKLELLLAELRDEALARADDGGYAMRRLLRQADEVRGAVRALRRTNPNRQMLLEGLLLKLVDGMS